MAKQQGGLTYEQIMGELKRRQFKPIYLLMGEEDYYIDLISSWIEKNVLAEEERDFNLTVVYGADTDADQVVMDARRYPLMSEYQVIIVKEAQNLKNLEIFSGYLKEPQPTSIIVLCFKHGTVDRRKKFATDIAKCGVIYESKRKYDSEIPGWISSYCREKSITIDPKAANMLAEFLGADLSRIASEIEKLQIVLSNETDKKITPELVERNIGISKDYNNFELVNAISERNILKAYRIVDNFKRNPNKNPLTLTIQVLFNFFSNLMLYHWLKDKSEMNVASELGINPFFVKDYRKAATFYNSSKVLQAIGILRTLDAESKGFGNRSNTPDGDLLQEAIYKIMH